MGGASVPMDHEHIWRRQCVLQCFTHLGLLQEPEPSEGQSLLAHWMAKASTQLDTMYNKLSRR
jgi:hypothetical protein